MALNLKFHSTIDGTNEPHEELLFVPSPEVIYSKTPAIPLFKTIN